MSKNNAARVREISETINDLVNELRTIATDEEIFLARYDAYLFNALKNIVNKANPYDMDLQDLANEIDNDDEEDFDEDEENN